MGKMATRARPVGVHNRDQRFAMWKQEHVPLLYDWVSSRRFAWPHAALCWGHPVVESSRDNHDGLYGFMPGPGGNNNTGNNNNNSGYGLRDNAGKYSTRALYLAERTGQTEDPNTLLYIDVRIVEEHFCQLREVASSWSTEEVVSNRSNMKSPDFKLRKRIVHPCEVNAIRNFFPGKVVTLGDNPELYVWNFDNQPHREYRKNEQISKPDTILKGHKEAAQFSLAVSVKSGSDGQYGDGANGNGNGNSNGNTNTNSSISMSNVSVASGGVAGEVLVWNLADWESMGSELKNSVRLCNHMRGHRKEVEAVGFNSTDARLLVSVARDKSLVLWDVRTPDAVSSVVNDAHNLDINAVDNFGTDPNLIATGGTDAMVKVWDKRKLTKAGGEPDPKHVFAGHTKQVNTVMWNRTLPGILASGSDDASVLIWDTEKDQGVPLHDPRNNLNGLIFNHAGHTDRDNFISALEWLPCEHDPWCIATLSEMGGGGSDLQVWRMSNFIHRDKDEVNQDLVNYSAS